MEEGRLAQVLLNLLVNAGQSIPAGHRADNWIRVRASEDKGTVRISVEDTGRGIPEDVLPNIFDPFFTTKPLGMGTGLGLAISKELVTKAEGTIRAENVQPHGARFTIELPKSRGTVAAKAPSPADGAAATAAQQSTAAPGAAHSRALPKLLLVDDEALVLRAVSRLLAPEFSVLAVASGEEAKLVIAAGGEFDVILCDLMMPQGSGLDLLDWLCAEHPKLAPRLIVMTGGGLERQALAAAHAAKPRLLSKPFSLEELKRLLGPQAAEVRG